MKTLMRARFAVVIALLGVTAASAMQYKVATVPEKTLRQFAKVVVMPVYPDASRRSGAQGVAVAELKIDEEGTVQKVQILEAPDDAIGNAVVMALKSWKFQRPVDDSTGKAVRLSGKLTFYFVIENGKGIVRNPQ